MKPEVNESWRILHVLHVLSSHCKIYNNTAGGTPGSHTSPAHLMLIYLFNLYVRQVKVSLYCIGYISFDLHVFINVMNPWFPQPAHNISSNYLCCKTLTWTVDWVRGIGSMACIVQKVKFPEDLASPYFTGFTGFNVCQCRTYNNTYSPWLLGTCKSVMNQFPSPFLKIAHWIETWLYHFCYHAVTV